MARKVKIVSYSVSTENIQLVDEQSEQQKTTKSKVVDKIITKERESKTKEL